MNKRNQMLTVFIASIALTSNSLNSVMPAYKLTEEDKVHPERHHHKSEHRTHTINVVVGQTFAISLDCQPSTGYTWYIAEPMMEDLIQLMGKTVIPYRCPGSRGKTTFTFQAIKAGYETVTFEYARPWSWDVAQRCTYTINIREKNAFHHHHSKPMLPPFMLPEWNNH